MKIFILLIFISCGKENNFQNQEALLSPIQIEGTLEFSREKRIIPFKIKGDSKQEFLKDFIRNKELVNKNIVYQVLEFEKLELPAGDQFDLKVKSSQSLPLVFINGNQVTTLNPENFILSKADILKINLKKAFLAFVINDQSYFKKVTILDQEDIKTFYIHKDDPRLPMEASPLSLSDIFHGTDISSKWYKKETPEGNLLFVFIDKNTLREFFLKESRKEVKLISREDGHTKNEMTLAEGFHFFKVKPTRLQNITTLTKQYSMSRSCSIDILTITSHYSLYVDFKTLESEISTPFSQLSHFRKFEENTNEGTLWYISFYIASPLKLSLMERPQNTFFQEGGQPGFCSWPYKLRNSEAKFHLDIESYLEPDL